MRILRMLAARVRGVFAGADADSDLRAELESHLAMHIADNVRRGMSPAEARREALLAAGGLTLAAEAVREQRGLPWIENLLSDIRYAFRTLRMNRAYSAAVVLTVALAIGANAAMFTIVNAVILKPLPYPDPDRIVSISLKDAKEDHGVIDDKTYFEWLNSARTVTIATSVPTDLLVTLGNETQSVSAQVVTASYFSVLGILPLQGRVFTANEAIAKGPNVIVVSEQFWRGTLGADSMVLGKPLTVQGKPFTIIGVMPASFTSEPSVRLWTPFRMDPPVAGETHFYPVTARLRDGVSMDGARAELATLRRRVEAQPLSVNEPPNTIQTPVLHSLHEARYGDTEKPLLLLFGAVGVLLLIACANLANLSLARALRREREFVVRRALGASRSRLAQYVLCESLLLTLLGAAIGFALSTIAVGYFVRLSPRSVGNMQGIHADGRVLLFTFIVAVLTAILFALIPAQTAGRRSLVEALSNGSPRAAGSAKQRWIRRVLVVAQLATALMLITGAGIVARTFWRVTSLDVGFRPERLLVTKITLPSARYPAGAAAAFVDNVLMRIREVPGVQAAGHSDVAPLSGIAMSVSHTDSTGKSTPRIDVVDVGPGYLETIGARIVAGRTIRASDRQGTPRVAVIDETVARLLFPGGAAVGQTLPFRGLTVVGVIKDLRQGDLESAHRPLMFFAAAQSGVTNRVVIVARTEGSPQALETPIRSVIRSIDAALPAPTFTTVEDRLAQLTAPRRFAFVLLALFATMAGVLAAIGLYGVLSYLVASRTREIGVRIALGADGHRVRRLVIGQGMGLAVTGIAIGVIGSLLGARMIESLVYQASVYDVRAFVGSAALLAVVAYVACYVPALRASRVDPLLALRAD